MNFKCAMHVWLSPWQYKLLRFYIRLLCVYRKADGYQLSIFIVIILHRYSFRFYKTCDCKRNEPFYGVADRHNDITLTNANILIDMISDVVNIQRIVCLSTHNGYKFGAIPFRIYYFYQFNWKITISSNKKKMSRIIHAPKSMEIICNCKFKNNFPELKIVKIAVCSEIYQNKHFWICISKKQSNFTHSGLSSKSKASPHSSRHENHISNKSQDDNC